MCQNTREERNHWLLINYKLIFNLYCGDDGTITIRAFSLHFSSSLKLFPKLTSKGLVVTVLWSCTWIFKKDFVNLITVKPFRSKILHPLSHRSALVAARVSVACFVVLYQVCLGQSWSLSLVTRLINTTWHNCSSRPWYKTVLVWN